VRPQPTRVLAEFVSSLKYEDLPPAVTDKVKQALLDAIGCAFFGLSLPWGHIMVELAQDRSARKEATVIGAGFQGDLEYACVANGTLIHSFDFDDYHRAKLHPAAAVIPAALAVGESENVSGEKLLEALVAGYETMIRISLGTGPNSSRLKGWHLTGTCGTFGAAAAIARMMNLEAAETQSALGLAGTQSSGLWAFNADGAMSKRFHPGRAAQSGLLAATLARRGFTGPGQILEAEDGGFCRATSDDVHFEKITDGLGEVFETQDVCIKPYACCGSIHSSIDAALDIRANPDFAVEDIDEIAALGSEVVRIQTGWDYQPSTVLAAQMSLKYCVAAALIDGDCSAEQFTPERITDEALVALANRITFEVDPELDSLYPAHFCGGVAVTSKSGKSWARRVYDPKGSPVSPLSDDDVIRKFVGLAEFAGKKDQVGRIVGAVQHLEELRSVKELTSLLV